MTRAFAVVAAGMALAAVPAGCGGDDDEGSEELSGQEAKEARHIPTEIAIRDFAFHPDRAETTKEFKYFEFVNEDSVVHDVKRIEGKGPDWESGPLKKGETFQPQIEAGGTMRYICSIHPEMKGTLVIDQ